MNNTQTKLTAFIILAFLVGTLFGTAQSWVYLAASNNVKGWNPFIHPTPISPLSKVNKVKPRPTEVPTPTDYPTATPEPTAIPYVPPRYIPPTATPVYNYVSPETNTGF